MYIDPSGYDWIDAIAGWAKSVDDSIFIGLGGKLANKIRSWFGKEQNDWHYLKYNNEDFALTYRAGSYANAIYGIVNLGSGLKKTITSGGEAIVTNSGEIVNVISGSEAGIIQAAHGLGITLFSIGNTGGSLEKSDHAEIRDKQGKPVGEANRDLQNAKQSDILFQEDGRWIIRGPKGRIHVVDINRTHITSFTNTNANTIKRIQEGVWNRPTLDQLDEFRNLFPEVRW